MFFTLGIVVVLGSSAPAPAFRCGLPDLHPGRPSFTAGINCQARPPLTMALQSTVHPLEVHYDPNDAALAAQILANAETSWAFESNVLGFPLPLTDGVEGGDADFDIYVENSQYGGYFCPQDSAGGSSSGWWGWVSISPTAFPADLVPAVVAHELNHARQMGLDAYEDQSFMEMTSAYVMDQVFDEINLASGYIPVFQASPEKSLDYYVYAEPYQYGASLFLFWLIDEVYGKNYDALTYLWGATPQPLGAANEPDYFDALESLAAASDLTLADLYARFAADRWFTGAHHDGTFEEGDTYDEVARAASWDRADLPAQGTESVSEFGAAYVEVVLDGGIDAIEVTFVGAAASTWRVYALKPGAGAGNDRDELVLDAQGVATVDGLAPLERAVLVFVNLGDGDHDPDDDDWAPRSLDYSIRAVGAGSGSGAGCGCTLTASARTGGAPTLGAAFFASMLAAGAIAARRRREN